MLMLVFVMLLTSCHFHSHTDHQHIDERYPFLGEYHAVESFVNPVTGGFESYEYTIEITPASGNELEIAVTGYGNGGVYGTNCSIIGSVYGAGHIDIPLNICTFDANTTFEIEGHGDLSADGEYLTFDLHIHRCDGPNCQEEPAVSIGAHRL